MSSPTTKTKGISAITPRQKLEGHADWVQGVVHLPDGQRIITLSKNGSLRVWNLERGKQIGEDWRDRDSGVYSIALSPDGKKVISGSTNGGVRLWDIDEGKVIAKWTGHTEVVSSVCWSRDGQRVLSGSVDGTARQWDVKSGETILAPGPIKTGHAKVFAAIYSPDTTMIATGGHGGDRTDNLESSIKIWDAKTGGLVATLKGHRDWVRCLAWTPDGETLISGSWDSSIRTWNTKSWEQIAVLDEHTGVVNGIAISPNGRILASASADETARLWNLDNSQPINSPLQHAHTVTCVSFSADGKLLATGCDDNNAYTWDVATIVKEAGLDELLLDPKANKPALRVNATRHPVQRRQPANRVPQGFFDVPPDHSRFSPRSHLHSSAPQGSTFLGRLFHRSNSDAHDTSPSSVDWARHLLKRRGRDSIEFHGSSPAVLEVPHAPGQRRNASAGAKRKTKPLRTILGSSRPPKPNATQSSGATQTQPSSQPQPPVSNSSTTPDIGDTSAATTSTHSRPDVMLRQAGHWTRLWLFICCTSPEYIDGHH